MKSQIPQNSPHFQTPKAKKSYWNKLTSAGLFTTLVLAACTTTITHKPVPINQEQNTPTISSEKDIPSSPVTSSTFPSENLDTPVSTEENTVIETPSITPQPELEATPEPVIEKAEEPLITFARQLYEENDLRTARSAFTQALDKDLSYEEEQEALTSLEKINQVIFLSTAEEGDLKLYTVVAGDTLAKIAKRNNTTWEFIRRLNNLSHNRIYVGQKLRLPKASFSLRVRKDRFAMDLLINGDFVKRYTIGTGVNDSTPEGVFKIKNRIPEPADGGYSFGHPENRLGTRWLGLENDQGYHGYGIHGCKESEYHLLGSECSLGCIRLHNQDVEEVFDIITLGAEVIITH